MYPQALLTIGRGNRSGRTSKSLGLRVSKLGAHCSHVTLLGIRCLGGSGRSVVPPDKLSAFTRVSMQVVEHKKGHRALLSFSRAGSRLLGEGPATCTLQSESPNLAFRQHQVQLRRSRTREVLPSYTSAVLLAEGKQIPNLETLKPIKVKKTLNKT